jgi:hypothetical protein
VRKIAIIFSIALVVLTGVFYVMLSSHRDRDMNPVAVSDPNSVTTREVSVEELISATDKLDWKSFELSLRPVYAGAFSSGSSRGRILEINVNDSWNNLSLDKKICFVKEKLELWQEITRERNFGIPQNQIIIEIRHLKSHRIVAGYKPQDGVYISRE